MVETSPRYFPQHNALPNFLHRSFLHYMYTECYRHSNKVCADDDISPKSDCHRFRASVLSTFLCRERALIPI